MPSYASFGLRVRELLDEIVVAASGKLILHQHDPKPFSESEDLATLLGAQGIPMDQGGELAYFGLVGVNSVDDAELIPFFQPEREKLLEYDIAQMIHALSNPEPTVCRCARFVAAIGGHACADARRRACALGHCRAAQNAL